MPSTSGRRFAARIVTFRSLVALALAAGLGSAPPARAQHAGAHGGHDSGAARASSARKPPADALPARKARGETRRAVRAHGHAGHGPSASDAPAVAEFKAAHADMMRAMDVPFTGDPDVDFRVQMIPHHQGAIDMARVALRRAKDPWTRQLAEAVIVEQQREIAEMRAWLARRGIAAAMADGARHTITASSYRSHDEEAGTRDEARGQSWAPGAGVPAGR